MQNLFKKAKPQVQRKALYFNSFEVLYKIEQDELESGDLCQSCMEDAKRDLQTIFDNNKDYSKLKPLVINFLENLIKNK